VKHKKRRSYGWKITEVIFFVVAGMLLSYGIIYTVGDPISYLRDFFQEEKVIINESIIEGCTNLNIFNSAVCLQKNVKNLPYKYNLSNADKDLTFEELKQQGGVCAICRNKETKKVNNKTTKLSLDHDWETGKIRGLLCKDCNVTLGNLKDDISLFYKCIEYLKQHS